MWKMTGKHDKGGEQRSENNNRNEGLRSLIRDITSLSFNLGFPCQCFSPCLHQPTLQSRERAQLVIMFWSASSWVILSLTILASYSSSAFQKSRSLSRERIYFPGQLESFPQSEDSEEGARPSARLNVDTAIPAEPPQGQFESALAG